MGIKIPLKELSTLVNDFCKKNNKDITLIKENEIININGSLYFNEFSFEAQDIKTKDKLNVMKFEKSKKYSIKLKLKIMIFKYSFYIIFNNNLNIFNKNNNLNIFNKDNKKIKIIKIL